MAVFFRTKYIREVVVSGGFVYTVVNREYSVMYCKSII